MISKILELSVKDVAERLGMDLRSKGNGEFGIKENGKKTDGRTLNERKNIVTDFSKGRPQGPSFQFVKSHLRLNDSETYNWFAENFGLSDKNRNKEFFDLPHITQEQKEYIKSRGINPDTVSPMLRNRYGGIAIRVFEDEFCEGIVVRNMSGENRFQSGTGSNGKAIYMGEIDKTKDYLFVVEGMFDFLSLYQFDKNVVGLRNRELGMHEIKRLSMSFERLYYIPDNDDQGKASVELMQSIEPLVFDLSELGFKDTNELIKAQGNVLPEIMSASKRKSEILGDRIVPYTRGLSKIDKRFGLFDDSDLCVVAGYNSMGKSEFCFFCARANAEKGNKTVYYTIELSPVALKKRIAIKKAGISKIDSQTGSYSKEQADKANEVYRDLSNIKNLDLVGFDEIPAIDKVIDDITEKNKKGYNLFFVDNLGNFGGSSNEVERLNEITQRLQLLKNRLGICIVLIHHMSKPPSLTGMCKPGGVGRLRSSQKIVDNATIVMEVWRSVDEDDGDKDRAKTELHLYKDTFSGETGSVDIYFHNGTYHETYLGV